MSTLQLQMRRGAKSPGQKKEESCLLFSVIGKSFWIRDDVTRCNCPRMLQLDKHVFISYWKDLT